MAASVAVGSQKQIELGGAFFDHCIQISTLEVRIELKKALLFNFGVNGKSWSAWK